MGDVIGSATGLFAQRHKTKSIVIFNDPMTIVYNTQDNKTPQGFAAFLCVFYKVIVALWINATYHWEALNPCAF